MARFTFRWHPPSLKRIVLFIALLFAEWGVPSANYAWQHAVHKTAAAISMETLSNNCPRHFNFNDLIFGSTESDLHRHLLINPSHKKDHWRIEKSFKAALKLSGTDRSLSSRRIARAFHYILDQSEPNLRLRKQLRRATGLDFREVGWRVLARERGNGNSFGRRLSRVKLKYAKLDWPQLLKEVGEIQARAEKGIKDTVADRRKSRKKDSGYGILRKSLVEYLTAVIALQNIVMHKYCVNVSGTRETTGKETWCRQYGNQAVSQHKQNLKEKCGFGGPVWSDDFNNHFRWCMGAPVKQSKEGDALRQDHLNRCRQANARCRPYGSTAVAQNKLNISRKCGYSGPVWSNDFNQHFKWCRKANAAEARRGTRLRQKMLNDCSRQKRQ